MEDKKVSLKCDLPYGIDSERSEKDESFGVFHVPIELHREICENLGKGKERRVSVRGISYSMTELDSDRAGFKGAVGIIINEACESVRMVLWGRIPGEADDIFESKPVLEIIGITNWTESWAYGMGNFAIEDLKADFPIGGVRLNDPAIKLASFILYRANELTKDPRYKSRKYWESERFPDKDFSKY